MEALRALAAGQSVGGVTAGAGPWLVAQARPRPGWIVVPTPEEAARWIRSLRYHLRGQLPVLPYPADDNRPFDGLSPAPELPRQRVLARLRTDALIVAPARALLAKVPTLESRLVQTGKELPRGDLLRWLVAWGYVRTQELDGPGAAVVRGAVLEIWPSDRDQALRIEWEDDEVVGIRQYNPGENNKPQRLTSVLLHPMREAHLDRSRVESAVGWIHQRAGRRDGRGPDRRLLIQDLRDGHWWSGAEVYLPALSPLSPLELPTDVIRVEPDAILAEQAAFLELARRRYLALPEEDRPYVDPSDLYLQHPPVLVGPVLSPLGSSLSADLSSRSNADYRVGGGDLEPVARRLKERREEGDRVTVVSESAVRAERLTALFSTYGLRFVDGPGRPGKLGLEVADLPEGCSVPGQLFLTAAEIFGERLSAAAPTSTASQRFKRAASGFANLKRGDLVVHSRHGIGLYQGLARLPLGETEGDFVLLEYRNGEKLYVPVHRLDLLAPFRAVGDSGAPPLDRLGGSTWEIRKAKVKDNLLELAHQLLETEARRQQGKSLPFGSPSSLYRQFEETFAYDETPDQATSIDEVLADLEGKRPMDRLLVGDVGFGKTEVAMRAAFRAVEEGYQVAVMCPTTVLAWQHLQTFRERFSGFPVRIEGLSRFEDSSASRKVVKELAEGKVDILVGTHRLLARSVRFRKLGLVVVDEEHRFGVKQKQELKRLTVDVHYLAMSATPIPRTLQMALSGMRSLSVITTPPLGRKPIRTEVVRYSKDRVQEDLRAELRRGGQAFFVHNRVQSIAGVARWVRELVPEARVDIGHGQMPEDQLEAAMLRFVRRETDILVCTTIIESGIDLPLVNTMIVNRAEGLGLAQLYQLRGRIGRGDVPARCTLMVSGEGAARKKAMERLMALQEATALGSGMALAGRDLEMRGSGDLLGDRQHGAIAAIGFDAYVELLQEAVARVRGEPPRVRIEPELEVPIPCLIPEDFVADLGERLEVYRQLSSAGSRSEISAPLKRLEQRYGRLPESVENLRWMSICRVAMRDLAVARAAFLKVRMVLDLHPSTPIPSEALLALCKKEPGRFRLTPEGMLAVHFTPEEGQQPFRMLEWALGRLASLRTPASERP